MRLQVISASFEVYCYRSNFCHPSVSYATEGEIIIIIIIRIDGKRPDRLTLIPWQGGKPLTWDVTVVSTLADSYLHSTSHSAGSAAESASIRKESKYSSLPPEYLFQPVAIETLGPLNASAVNFLSEVGRG